MRPSHPSAYCYRARGVALHPPSSPLRSREHRQCRWPGRWRAARLTSTAMTGTAEVAGSFRLSPGDYLRSPIAAAFRWGYLRASNYLGPPVRLLAAAGGLEWRDSSRAAAESDLCLCTCGSQARPPVQVLPFPAGWRVRALGGSRGRVGGRRGAPPDLARLKRAGGTGSLGRLLLLPPAVCSWL